MSGQRAAHYDVVIRDTTIIDGTGAAAYRGSVAIKEGKIAGVGAISGTTKMTIHGDGLITCPGFIDPHSHADVSILKYPLAESKIMQGITTFVGGNCGASMAPIMNDFTRKHVTRYFNQDTGWESFGEYLDRVTQTAPAVNMVPLVGHNPIRGSVMGEDFKRKSTANEVLQMQQHVQEAMDSGAFGFTTGLDSSFGEYADLDEIVPLASVAAKSGGLYATHVRHNQFQWPAESLEEFGYGLYHGPLEEIWIGRYRGYQEAINVGRRAKIHVHISHLANAFAVPQPHPDFLATAVARATLAEFIDKPAAEGVRVTFDTIFSPSSIATPAPLLSAFQSALKKYGKAGLVEQLIRPDFRQELQHQYNHGKIKMGMVHPIADPFWMDSFQIVTHKNPQASGKLLADWMHSIGGHPVDILIDLILEDPDAIWSQIKDKKRTGPGLIAFLEHPICIPCTDTFAYSTDPDPDDYKPPAIAYGMYPGFIDFYVRQQSVLSLEQAIYRITQLVANTFGLKRRGALIEGFHADIVMLDLENLRMRGDALHPARPPDGIEYVLVNGQVVYQNQQPTGVRPGHVLRRHLQ